MCGYWIRCEVFPLDPSLILCRLTQNVCKYYLICRYYFLQQMSYYFSSRRRRPVEWRPNGICCKQASTTVNFLKCLYFFQYILVHVNLACVQRNSNIAAYDNTVDLLLE